MSYDINLVIDTGGEYLASVMYVGNYTYNVAPMLAKALGFPFRDLHGRAASDCIAPLADAIARFERDFAEYEKLNPANGWGDAAGALDYLRALLKGCREHPKTAVRIS